MVGKTLLVAGTLPNVSIPAVTLKNTEKFFQWQVLYRELKDFSLGCIALEKFHKNQVFQNRTWIIIFIQLLFSCFSVFVAEAIVSENPEKDKPSKMKESIPEREGCACADSVEKEESAWPLWKGIKEMSISPWN